MAAREATAMPKTLHCRSPYLDTANAPTPLVVRVSTEEVVRTRVRAISSSFGPLSLSAKIQSGRELQTSHSSRRRRIAVASRRSLASWDQTFVPRDRDGVIVFGLNRSAPRARTVGVLGREVRACCSRSRGVGLARGVSTFEFDHMPPEAFE